MRLTNLPRLSSSICPIPLILMENTGTPASRSAGEGLRGFESPAPKIEHIVHTVYYLVLVLTASLVIVRKSSCNKVSRIVYMIFMAYSLSIVMFVLLYSRVFCMPLLLVNYLRKREAWSSRHSVTSHSLLLRSLP